MQMTESGLWVPDWCEKSIEEYQDKINELTETIQEIATTSIMKNKTSDDNFKRQEEVKTMINMLNREKAAISKKMNQKRLVELTVIFINPLTNEEIQSTISAGDTLVADYNTLYPLDLYGKYYTLLRKDYIEAVIYKNQ